MSAPRTIQEIDDISILKEKIIKVDTLFALISEKQSKIKVVESKYKDILQENTKLSNKNNELLNEIDKNTKEYTDKMDKYQEKLLEEYQKCAQFEELLTNARKKSKHRYATFKTIVAKYKRRLQKFQLQKDTSDKQYSGQIYKLRKTIKLLRNKLKSLPSPAIQENILTDEQQNGNLSEDNLLLDIEIEQLLNEMITLPNLFERFAESPVQMLSIQTQTTRSSVTRPVQTVIISKATKDTQTEFANLGSVDSIGIQCSLDAEQLLKGNVNFQHSQSQTCCMEYDTKTTQTINVITNHQASQETQTEIGNITTGKITMKRAVSALKLSRGTFTISNGRLIHYSKQPMSTSSNNESLIARNVFRRLKKYIDKSYGQRKSWRNSNVLTEAKQLERSRELMQLCRLGMASFTNNSDTESSCYESRNYRREGSSIPSVDSGVCSEAEIHTTKKDKKRKSQHDVDDIFKEVFLPEALSPLDDESNNSERRKDNENIIINEDLVLPEIQEKDNGNENMVLPEKQEDKCQRNKCKKGNKPKDRLALLRRRIKKCNQVNITRMAARDAGDSSFVNSNRRMWTSQMQIASKSVKAQDDKTANSSETSNDDDGMKKELVDKTKIGCDFNLSDDMPIANLPDASLNTVNLNTALVQEEFTRMKERCIASNKPIEKSPSIRDLEAVQADNVPKKLMPAITLGIETNVKPRLSANHILNILDTLDTSPPQNDGIRRSPRIAAFVGNKTSPETPQKSKTSRNYKRHLQCSPISRRNIEAASQISPVVEETTAKVQIANEESDVLASGETVLVHLDTSSSDLNSENNQIIDASSPKIEECKKISFYGLSSDSNKQDSLPITNKNLNEMHNYAKPSNVRVIGTNEMTTRSGKIIKRPVLRPQEIFLPNANEFDVKRRRISDCNPTTQLIKPQESLKIVQNNTSFKEKVRKSEDTCNSNKQHVLSHMKIEEFPICKKEVVEEDADADETEDTKTTFVPFNTAKKLFDHIVWMRGSHKDCQTEFDTLKVMDPTTLVRYIFYYLLADKGILDNHRKTTESLEPLLTIPQKVLMGIVLRLDKDNNNTPLISYIALLIDTIEKYLLFNDKRNIEAMENIARFYTALCRINDNKAKIRTFLADFLYFTSAHKFDIIYTIITSWLNLLPKYSAIDEVGFVRVLVYICLTQQIPASEANENSLGVLKHLLVSYYKYPKDPESVDDLMMSLIESYICEGHAQFKASILVLSMYNSPEWTYEKIQLIGELCKVSEEEDVIRNLITLITLFKKRMPFIYKHQIDEFACQLFSSLQKKSDKKYLHEIKELLFKNGDDVDT